MHPYEIAQTLRERHKHESIRLNYGSLYGVVKSLERPGLIEPVGTSREGRRPQRTTYELTQAGRKEMRAWLSELVTVPVKEYLQFEAALSLLHALPPDDALYLLRRRCVSLEHRIEEGREELAQVQRDFQLPRLFLIEAEYMLTLLDAELAWTRVLADDIESGRLEGLDRWRAFFDTQPEAGRHRPPAEAEPQGGDLRESTDET